MADFPATARIPCKPLSVANKDLAEPKELLVDYTNGKIVICKEDGTFADIESMIREVIKEDTSFANSIQIEIDGVKYNINTIIAKHDANIKDLNDALGYYLDESGNVKFDLLDKIASIDPDTGDIIFNITTEDINETNEKQFISADEKELLHKIASTDPDGNVVYNITTEDIQETAEKQFVSAAEKATWSKATHSEIIKCTILGGSSAWTGTSAPYTQNVTVANIKETDTPVVDISLGDVYETTQRQLDDYVYIYKILTFDGYITVYATNPTQNDLTIQMKVDR